MPWDRFQTLAGIQYYFDTEFQLVRGHVYYSGSGVGPVVDQSAGPVGETGRRWAATATSRVLSVDIGDFNTPSSMLLDEHGRGKAARDCTADEIAAEVWRQIVAALTSAIADPPEAIAAVARLVRARSEPGHVAGPECSGQARSRNEAPYLVPIVGDWPNRPGAEPWNPHESSWTTRADRGRPGRTS